LLVGVRRKRATKSNDRKREGEEKEREGGQLGGLESKELKQDCLHCERKRYKDKTKMKERHGKDS